MNQSLTQETPSQVRALDDDPLAEAVLEVAHPLLQVLPRVPDQEVLADVLSLVVEVWNAHALATACWKAPQQLARMEAVASRGGIGQLLGRMYSVIAERRRTLHADDPRVVADWALHRAADGSYVLECEARLRIRPGTCLPPGSR